MQLPLVVPNYFSDDQCARLIDCLEDNQNSTDNLPTTPDFWKNRCMYWEKIPSSYQALKDEIRPLILAEINLITNHFDFPAQLWAETINIVRWPVGYDMQPHIDNQNNDGSSNGMPQRTFSSVIYLNDNYEGGEVYFPKVNMEIKPRKGMMVAFLSGPDHMHGVRGLKNEGDLRYTFPVWYTSVRDKQNHSL
jgi:hypothetical protein